MEVYTDMRQTEKNDPLTSINVSVRFIGSQEHGLTRFQNHIVEKVNGEAANVSRILGVEAEQQVTSAAGCVLPCCA